jgi:pimeloyl-ACP methyl ester carboxylesterase
MMNVECGKRGASRFLLLLLFCVLFMAIQTKAQQQRGHHAKVNNLELYYEIHGEGRPLVLLHGGGSTITTTFGRILPLLAQRYKVVAVELQAHGHTPDRDTPLRFEQDADDVAALLQYLKISKANILGFSNGGTTAIQVALRHPQLVDRLILASAIYSREGMQPGFFDMMKSTSLDQMPAPLKDEFRKINPDPKALETMFNRDVERMLNFEDIPEEGIKTIQAPCLVISGDRDVVRTEHALRLSQLISNARLAILPGGHGEYIGEICTADAGALLNATVLLVKDFLESK